MKIKRLANVRSIGLVALGVFLGRGAQADTVVDFDFATGTAPGNNNVVNQSFGDYAEASTNGVTVTGFGTPNIGLSWQGSGATWQYYNDSVWSAAQLDSSNVGDSHSVVFTPNSASARVVVKSFNFHPYYVSDERYTYSVSVLAGATVVSGPTNLTFISDSTKNHPVSMNYTGALGQTLKLKITRLASVLTGSEFEGSSQDIAVDDIRFAQLPENVFPVGPQVVSVSPADDDPSAPGVYSYRASITNGATAVAAGSIQLRFDGSLVSPAPTISSANGLTNVSFQAPGLLAPGSTHRYTLTYADTGGPPATYTNEVNFIVANYPTLPASYAYPTASASTRGFTFRTVKAPLGTPELPNALARAREQLDGTLIDPLTGLPYDNEAVPGPNPDGSYNVDTVLDFDNDGAVSGNFTNVQQFPGLSGFDNSFSSEALLFLDLSAGYYRLGVNSDDGFEVSAGTPPQGVFGPRTVLGFFDNGRGAADTLFDFLVQSNGIYNFRLIFFEGGGSASCELFSVDLATGQKVLLNDTNANAINSYRVLNVPQPPYVRYVQPAPDATDVPVDTAIRAGIWDRATAVVPPVQLTLNGLAVTPVTVKTGVVTTVTYQPPAPLAFGSTNTVRLVHGDGAISLTNTWSFVTVPRLRITSVALSGTDVIIEWVGGTPPFQVQFKDSLTNLVWTDSGPPTTGRTANIPIQPGAGFIRVGAQ